MTQGFSAWLLPVPPPSQPATLVGSVSVWGAIVEDPTLVMMKHAAVVVVHVKASRQSNLPEVGEAGGAFPFFLSRVHCWQKQGSENGYNGNHNEEFDQRESPPCCPCRSYSHGRANI